MAWRHTFTALALALVVSLPGLAAAQPASKSLQPADLDPTLILPPPAADGSAFAAAELAELRRIDHDRTAARLAQAREDDEVEDVRAFAAVVGPGFDLAKLPKTAKLFADLRAEDSAAAKRAKAYFQRTRPWAAAVDLTPCSKEDAVRSSYPSGHATMGYAAAGVLARLDPPKAQALLARASDFAESRLVCGAHYRSDTTAGQALAAVLVVKLLETPAFRAEFEAARGELKAAGLVP